ncbi:hypothetical protein [Bacillus sp. FSL W7-1336]|uniref:hypothetical protein n=2 Tax=Bacillaceae TaxID=186817 RepID=UPI003159C165
MMNEILYFLIIVSIFALQYFLSTRNHLMWGACIPIIFLIVMGWLYFTYQVNHHIGFIILLLVGLALLIEEWNRGRRMLHQKKKKEIEKMKSQDIVL